MDPRREAALPTAKEENEELLIFCFYFPCSQVHVASSGIAHTINNNDGRILSWEKANPHLEASTRRQFVSFQR